MVAQPHHMAVGSGLVVDTVPGQAAHHHGLHLYQAANTTAATDPLAQAAMDNLYPALVQCFGIILLGFAAGKFSIISDVEAKGLSTFVGTFSLPALIFVSMCQLDFSIVNWVFLASITLAKSLIFVVVLLVSLFLHQPLDPGRAALYAIFCTQSNDFALGFPVLQAIYGAKHPEYPMYLYLLAPVSLALLNPIGFILMEVGKMREVASDLSRTRIVIKVTQAIFQNPIIMMTVLGILGNLLFHSEMPDIIHNFMQTLGSAFSATALFLLGLRMVSSNSNNNNSNSSPSLILPLVLITMKSLVLPIISREIVYQLDAGRDVNETIDLSNYAFLYGTIPTAPSVFVYATKYGLLPDTVAATITASTFMAAPLMFVTAKLLTLMNMDPRDYIDQLDLFLLDVSVVGLLAAGWVLFVLAVTGRGRHLPHRVTAVLAVYQGTACLGAALWSLLDCSHGWRLYTQFVVFGLGVFGSRVATAVLAVTLLLLQTRGECAAARWRHALVATCLLLPAAIVLGLTVHVAVAGPGPGDTQDQVQYGAAQTVAALVTLSLSLLVTLLSLMLGHRYQLPPRQQLRAAAAADPDTEEEELSSEETDTLLSDAAQETPVEIEDLMLAGDNNNAGPGCGGGGGRYRCNSEHRKYCSGLIRRYEVPPAEDALSPESGLGVGEEAGADPQLLRHHVLLLLLSVSMFVGAALCIWTLVMDQFSGIYLELVFLDGFLNLGQSIFTLALFGVNAKGIVMRVRHWARKLLYGRDQMVLPPWEDLDQTTRAVSTMFIKHHLEACMAAVLHDTRGVLGTRVAVVTGRELVTWLQERGLVMSRQDGEAFGRHLVRGRVIRHVDNHVDFYDDKYVYTFTPEPGAH